MSSGVPFGNGREMPAPVVGNLQTGGSLGSAPLVAPEQAGFMNPGDIAQFSVFRQMANVLDRWNVPQYSSEGLAARQKQALEQEKYQGAALYSEAKALHKLGTPEAQKQWEALPAGVKYGWNFAAGLDIRSEMKSTAQALTAQSPNITREELTDKLQGLVYSRGGHLLPADVKASIFQDMTNTLESLQVDQAKAGAKELEDKGVAKAVGPLLREYTENGSVSTDSIQRSILSGDIQGLPRLKVVEGLANGILGAAQVEIVAIQNAASDPNALPAKRTVGEVVSQANQAVMSLLSMQDSDGIPFAAIPGAADKITKHLDDIRTGALNVQKTLTDIDSAKQDQILSEAVLSADGPPTVPELTYIQGLMRNKGAKLETAQKAYAAISHGTPSFANVTDQQEGAHRDDLRNTFNTKGASAARGKAKTVADFQVIDSWEKEAKTNTVGAKSNDEIGKMVKSVLKDKYRAMNPTAQFSVFGYSGTSDAILERMVSQTWTTTGSTLVQKYNSTVVGTDKAAGAEDLFKNWVGERADVLEAQAKDGKRRDLKATMGSLFKGGTVPEGAGIKTVSPGLVQVSNGAGKTELRSAKVDVTKPATDPVTRDLVGKSFRNIRDRSLAAWKQKAAGSGPMGIITKKEEQDWLHSYYNRYYGPTPHGKVPTYTQIANRARQDKQFRARLEGFVNGK